MLKLLERLRGKNQNALLQPPDGIHISITEACFMDCLHCDLGPHAANPKEPTTNQWKVALTKLYRWLGPCRVDFAGGEPLARNDMVEILKHTKSLNMYSVMTTNGWLIDDAMAGNLVAAGLRSINVSIESTNPAIHDFIRNKEGSHQRATEAIGHLRNHRNTKGFNITVATVIMDANLETITDLVEYARTVNALINFQCIYQNFGAAYDPKWYETSNLWPHDPERVVEVLSELIELKKQGAPINNTEQHLNLMKQYFKNPERKAIFECLVGERMMAINALGDVSLCFFTDPVGNIIHQDPKEIWHSAEAKQMRKLMKCCPRNCDLLNCNYQRNGKEA